MPPPALLVASLVFIPVSIGIALAYIFYRRLRARRIERQTQHASWHRRNDIDIELSPIKTKSTSKQAVTRGDWPRNLREEQIVPKRFTPLRTFATSKWGTADSKASLKYPGPACTFIRYGGTDNDTIVRSWKKTTLDSEEASSFPYHAGDRESSDPAREIWRKIEARERLEDRRTGTDQKKSEPVEHGVVKTVVEHTFRGSKEWPLNNTAVPPLQGDTEEGFRVDKVAKQYALAAERQHLKQESHEYKALY
ncbi:hypothetical protein BU25DRAFT_463746 [Macroventuria anomochaeta]|uniref:Uncharacterized protein n=1 Tax=Macroventuria anomochaeta TaxID=301207 RepID=A0ACB6RJ62_9PLEO|nr:uncharacterized protein BU25DRAFT_463746 [Macroventuria anomochaeta]KAF2621387.1 hypothetical protein BU25DRAFT_463746 [Macroventuria anomochaeta]